MLIFYLIYTIISHLFFIFPFTNEKKPKIIYNDFTNNITIKPEEAIEYEIVKDVNYIEIDLYPISGKPVLFKYLCKTIDCTIKSSNYLELHHQNLLQDSIRVGKQYITYIFPEEIPSQEIEDTLLVVAYCSGDKNCSFYLSGIKSFTPIVLNKNIKLISGQMGIDNNYKIEYTDNETLEFKFTFIYGSGNVRTNKYDRYLKGNSFVIRNNENEEEEEEEFYLRNDEKDEMRIFIQSPSNLYFFEYYDNESYSQMYNNLVVNEEITYKEIHRIEFIKEDFKINSNNNNTLTLISFKSQNCELIIKTRNNNLNDEVYTNFYSIITNESNLYYEILINTENKNYGNKFCFYQMYSMDLDDEPHILLSENVPMTLEFNNNFSSFTSQMAIIYISKLPYKYILEIEPEEKTFYEIYISIQNKKFKYKVLYKRTIYLLDYIQKYCETSMICIINALIKNKNEKDNPKITLIFKAIENVPYFIPKNTLITDNFKQQLYVYTEIINDEYFEFFSTFSNNIGKSYGFLTKKGVFETTVKGYPIEIENDCFNLFMDEFNHTIIFNNNTNINCSQGCYLFFKLESLESNYISKGNFYLRTFNNIIKIKENEDIIGFINENNEEIIYSLNMNYNVSKFIFNIQSKGIQFLIQYENSDNNFIIPNNNTENFKFYGEFYNKEINVTIKILDKTTKEKHFIFKIIPQFINDKDILPLSEFTTISCDTIGSKICYFYYHSLNDKEKIISFTASEDFNLTNKILSYNILNIENTDFSLEEIQNQVLIKKENQTDSSMKPIFQISLSSEVFLLIEINLIENVISNPIKLYLTKIINKNYEFPINMILNQEMIFGIEMKNEGIIKIDFTHQIKQEYQKYKYKINSRYGFGKFVYKNIQRIINGNFIFNPEDNEEFYITTNNNQIFIFSIKLVIDNDLLKIEDIILNSQNTFIISNYEFPINFYIDVRNFTSYNINLKIKNPDIGTDFFINLEYLQYESYICEKKNNEYNKISKLNITDFELEGYLIISSFKDQKEKTNENYILITINVNETSISYFHNLSYIEFDILGYNTEKNYNYLSKGAYFYGAMYKKNQKTEYLLPDIKTFEFATCSNNIFNLTFKYKNKTTHSYYNDTKNEKYGKLLYEENENEVFIEIENLNETNELVYYTLKSGIEKDVFYFPEGRFVNSTYSNKKFEIKYSNIEKENVNFNFNERYLLRINASSLLSNHSICYQKKYYFEEINNIKSYNVNLETDKIIGYSVVAFFYDDNIEEMFISYDMNDFIYEKPKFIIVVIIIIVIFGLIVFVVVIYLFSKVKQMEQNIEELEDIDYSQRKRENTSYSFDSNSSISSYDSEK